MPDVSIVYLSPIPYSIECLDSMSLYPIRMYVMALLLDYSLDRIAIIVYSYVLSIVCVDTYCLVIICLGLIALSCPIGPSVDVDSQLCPVVDPPIPSMYSLLPLLSYHPPPPLSYYTPLHLSSS